MQYLGKGGGIKVLPTQPITQYIQAVDVCNSILYDTLTVYATPLGVGDVSESSRVFVYPNPSSNKIIVKSDKRIANSEKELYNSVGQLIFSTKENEIDVSRYSKGVYYLKCGAVVRKVVVE